MNDHDKMIGGSEVSLPAPKARKALQLLKAGDRLELRCQTHWL